MAFSEKDIETLIYRELSERNYDSDIWESLINEHRHEGILWVKRQVNMGAYGIADIVFASRIPSGIGHSRDLLHVEVVELKKNLVDIRTLIQAERYRRCVYRFIQKKHPRMIFKVSSTLIGSGLNTSSDWLYLTDTMPDTRVFTFRHYVDGISLESHEDFASPKEKLPESKQSFINTHYDF
jgi:hypothetical protein